MKTTFLDKIEQFSYKIGQQKHIIALRDGMVQTMPLILVGSLFVIIQSFPVPAWEAFLTEVGAMSYLGGLITGTFGIMGLVAVFGIAKRLADSYKVDGTSAGVIAWLLTLF
ncbi:TPA: PTS transporter subunit EIIC [Streptococcus suis]